MNDLRYFKRHSDPRVVGQEDFLADCASAAFCAPHVQIWSGYHEISYLAADIFTVIVMENIFPLLTLGRYLFVWECIYCQT